MVSQKEFVESAKTMQSYIRQNKIDYVPNGSTLRGMDCQGLCEFLLGQSGVPDSERDYAGSNDMWRNALHWRGTPENCLERFGEIPPGAWLFIHAFDGGEPAHYNDDQGNAYHVGVYIGDGIAIHASSSRGCVAESSFKGKSINGGWNMVGLCKHVEYLDQGGNFFETAQDGLEGESDLHNVEGYKPKPTDEVVISEMETTTKPTIAVPDFAPMWEPVYSNYAWSIGDRGEGTREVQRGLRKAGYDLKVDGIFELATDWAVKHFQKAQGLTADGVVGEKTWTALVDKVNASC